MKETGILFTPDNIRAIREGRKTQTRRVADTFGEGMHYGKKLCEWSLSSAPFCLTEEDFPVWHWRGIKEAQVGDWAQEIQTEVDDNCTCHIRNPYGKAGDRLYIKEGVIIHAEGRTLAGYYMDGARVTNLGEKRLTAMFMAKRYARTWLEITDIRVERVRDISEEDAKAEGVEWHNGVKKWRSYDLKGQTPFLETTAASSYRTLWDSINKKKHPFSLNPWVWVLEFKQIK